MQDLVTELNIHRSNLNKAIKELKERGQAKAKAERDYRVELSKEILKLRAEGMPVTIISDVCRGNKKIANLKMERDIAESLYESNMQYIYSTKINIEIVQKQIESYYEGRIRRKINMDIKVIENALKDYKRKKSVVETTLARVENYKETINNPDSFEYVFLGSPREPGMPRGTGGKKSLVELAIEDKEEAIGLLKEWIKDDQSRIYPYQIELEQLNGALNALTRQERFIIECKYFENMFWRDIEINFNDKFRQQNYITVSGIRKMNSEALELLARILEPYYMRFKIKK